MGWRPGCPDLHLKRLCAVLTIRQLAYHEVVGERAIGVHFRLRRLWNAVHFDRHPNTMPMDRVGCGSYS
jgi:hypothetical protein